ncbi:MAG: hypothetical protein CMK09_12050 [Ponticaulis sp.]|nr:hypothetical protein [Ponticaulis sp.]|tara:strand:- start:47164 stop:48051 length:888 start_codon:yes stop_codon:yes gene_type:complete
MKYALPASLVLHLAIGASGLFAWSIAPSGPSEVYVEVPLDIVSLANETNIQEVVQRRDEPEPETEQEDIVEQEGEEEPPPPEPEAAPPEAEVEEEIAAPPEEVEDPEPEPTPEPTPTPTPTPTETPKPTRNTTEPKKNADPFADLESRTQDIFDSERERDRRPERRDTSSQALEDQDQAPRRGAGDRTAVEATVSAVIKSHIVQSGCFRSLKDLPDWRTLAVTARFRLDESGRLLGQPRIINSSRPINRDTFIAAAAERALRAIVNCQPYPLDPADYDYWRDQDLEFTFDESLSN